MAGWPVISWISSPLLRVLLDVTRHTFGRVDEGVFRMADVADGADDADE